ncbi:rolling circle replication-associated protein [Yersinia enterocolitica]|uniref:rolling circle replication-associated protein n=1 Tax=Yersinia enterocolitica TaxID=630 RepID=UPI003D05AC79|nr:inovirus-type Gp2 protein [Yersinia enterocolitica]EKN4047465.1 inovirus-type Gp2 protein [Yersinia enterocolitica]
MQRHYPHFKKITPNDFLLNMINHHLNQILMRHSKILAFRMDFDYKRGTSRFIRNSSFEIQDDLRELTLAVMKMPQFCGCFWVLEWTKTNAIHAHAIFYLKGQKHQKSFPFMQQTGELWLKITNDEGKYERCKPKDCYQDDINTVVGYDNDEDVNSLRRIASYLTKESQKNGNLIWGCNEVPAPARQGRPRTAK